MTHPTTRGDLTHITNDPTTMARYLAKVAIGAPAACWPWLARATPMVMASSAAAAATCWRIVWPSRRSTGRFPRARWCCTAATTPPAATQPTCAQVRRLTTLPMLWRADDSAAVRRTGAPSWTRRGCGRCLSWPGRGGRAGSWPQSLRSRPGK